MTHEQDERDLPVERSDPPKASTRSRGSTWRGTTALANGIPSPDGRYLVTVVNLGDTCNNEQYVLKARDRAEQLMKGAAP
jgi:hypothetical protein